MFEDFGVPPTADKVRAVVETRLEDLRGSVGVLETLRVEWREKPIHVEVIDMPVDMLYYNPGTHRVRAQRSYDPVRDSELEADPWGPQGQEYLHYLLQARPSEPERRDPDFDALKESLRAFHQNEPALITREGVLVNGNTRRAALKELGFQSIRVGILPTSCTWDDVNAIEVSLQLRPDERRPYSYINQLIAVDEEVRLGRPLAVIAKKFHTNVGAINRDLWVHGQLQDLISRSETGGFKLRLMDLERSQEKLAELYRAYDKLQARSKEKADVMRESRLAAIVLDCAKTDVRNIDPDFPEKYLSERLPESVLRATASTAPTAAVIPGLNRSVQPAGAAVARARALTDMLLQARALSAAGMKAPSDALAAAESTLSQLQDAFKDALDLADRDSKIKRKRQAAPARIAEAAKHLQQCTTDLVLARGNGSLDENAFDDALIQLRAVMSQLAVEARRSVDLPDEGLSWLLSAVGDRQGPA